MAARHTEVKKRKKKGGIITVNMKGVEGKSRIKTGDQVLKVREVELNESANGEYLTWVFEGEEGGVVYHNTSLLPQALWNLRGILEALGQEVPDDEMDIDPADMVGLEMMGCVEMGDEYQGKKKPIIADYWPVEDADEKPAKKKSKKSKASKEDDDSDDDSDAGDDQDDDADEDEKPARGKKKSKKSKKAAVTQDDVQDMGEDELVDLISEHELDLDLDDFGTLRKKKAAVIDALMEAGVIEE